MTSSSVRATQPVPVQPACIEDVEPDYRVYITETDHAGRTTMLVEVDPTDVVELVAAVNGLAPMFGSRLQGGVDYENVLENAALVAEFRARFLRFAIRVHNDPACGSSCLAEITDDEGKRVVAYRMTCEAVIA